MKGSFFGEYRDRKIFVFGEVEVQAGGDMALLKQARNWRETELKVKPMHVLIHIYTIVYRMVIIVEPCCGF